jgi:predicted nucleic acid-binding protein
MIFADLAAGASVFVDTNILTYHFQPHPTWGPPCSQLLQRIENQELFGFTSTNVLGELAHRLMTIEANTVFGWPFASIGNRLRSHPLEVRKLNVFRLAIEKIIHSNLQVLTLSPTLLATAVVISQQIGLLTNDGIIVALMQANGLTNIASSDADFDRVPGLTRYAPA